MSNRRKSVLDIKDKFAVKYYNSRYNQLCQQRKNNVDYIVKLQNKPFTH